MCWSFARDGALPGSHIWAKVNALTGTPINAMLLMVTLAVSGPSLAFHSSVTCICVMPPS
jgi:choline transport protein